MKLKNSKYKNTGLIFELLSRQVVKDVLKTGDPKSLPIIKKYFRKGTELHTELSLYKAITETNGIKPQASSKLVDIVLIERAKLNKRKLKREKYNLIKEVKETHNIDDLFSARVENYRVLGNIYRLFEHNPSEAPAEYAVCHNKLVEQIQTTKKVAVEESNSAWDNQDTDVKKIAFNMLIEKFNNKYKDLSTRQKTLVRKYLNEDIQTKTFKDYVIAEVSYISTKINDLGPKVADKAVTIKLDEGKKLLSNILTSRVLKENQLSAMLKYYELIDILEG